MIDFAGADRITFVTNDVVSAHGTVVKRSRTFVWSTSGASSNLISTSESSVDGLQSWSTLWNGSTPLTTHRQTDFYPASNLRVETITKPDGTYAVTSNRFGHVVSATSFGSLGLQISGLTYGADAHGRQDVSTDSRCGSTTSFFNDMDQISGTISPVPGAGQSAQVTSNYFDVQGRTIAVKLPDDTFVTNKYDVTGLLTNTFGSRTYPVGYTFDVQGRMKTMTTWKNFAANSGAAVTTWNYDVYRGWLTNKTYDGGSAGPSYTYTAAGRLATRTWARGIVTSYSHNDAGDLAGVSYSDGVTPSVGYAFDRRGRQTAIANGSATCSYVMDDAGTVLSESYSGGPLNGITVTNRHDQFLRRTNLTVEPAHLVTSFGFDTASRFAAVGDGTNTAAYSYLANSPLVSQISFTNAGVQRMVTTKEYDLLDRLTNIASVSSVGTMASFASVYNSANQRTRRTDVDSSYWLYAYDSLGQVTSGKRYWSDGTPVAGQQFEYAFDDIGNRTSTHSGGDQFGANLRSASYGANSLNQYTNRTVPSYLDVQGEARTNATVTIWNSDGTYSETYRRGEFYRGELPVTNSAQALWLTITNLAALNNGTNADIITNTVGNRLVAKTPETFTYDPDGNLTSDGLWTNAWDGENRLISMQSLSSVPAAARKKLDFQYDHGGRRIEKIVSGWNGTAYVAQSTNRFVYDGWNLIATLGQTNSVITSFVWGLDLSGTEQGAGGVGGLLSMTLRSDQLGGNYLYCFDGNGKVMALVKADGTVSAHYEYGAFGEVIREAEPLTLANPFRFSTKYQDNESDLLYYGFRYYKASTGRWLTRDVVEELGGMNVYAMLANDAANRVDLFGLADTELHHIIPEWLARYTVYGARSQGLCIRLTTDFHRLSTGFNLEAELTPIRNQLQAGLINQAQAYNRVLLVHLRNLPAIIRNNRQAVGMSGASALALQGAVRAGLAQVGYFTYGQAALGATGIGLVGSGAYFVYDVETQMAELDNSVLEQQGSIDTYNRQIELARRASDADSALILDSTSGLLRCNNQQGRSACADKFKAALNRSYYFIETIGLPEQGMSNRQAKDAVSEQLFNEYLQCLKKSGCCIPECK